PKTFKRVTQEDFFANLGDSHPRHEGNYPYTAVFQTHTGRTKGIAEQYIPEGCGLPKTSYYLPGNQLERES
ncbi:MAG: hypothetical protein KC587_18645, partial [Nitrospira sp.]|nr:hypothetical protein [Nitrospira sp.]